LVVHKQKTVKKSNAGKVLKKKTPVKNKKPTTAKQLKKHLPPKKKQKEAPSSIKSPYSEKWRVYSKPRRSRDSVVVPIPVPAIAAQAPKTVQVRRMEYAGESPPIKVFAKPAFGTPGVKKPRRKITRRKPGTKPSVNYFSMDTQATIVDYQKEPEPKLKEKLYVKQILPAFDSLVENLINVYGFKVMYESKKNLKAECLEFLYSTVNKYDVTKGSKAFSYFNVIAKNWLTIKSKQNVKRIKTYISADDKNSFSKADIDRFESFNVVPSYEDIVAVAEANKTLVRTVGELSTRVKTDNEVACVNAIKQIIDNLDNIDILNKRAVLLYIREITGLSSKQLSVCLASLKKHYREIKKSRDFN